MDGVDAVKVEVKEPTANRVPVVMTIAGSDSGGGAGLQADLKVFNALGCFGTCAVTCVTAQNPDEVRAVEALSPTMVAAQIETVCDSFPVAAVKTGMLFSADIIEAVAVAVRHHGLKHLVVDPVMVATSGGSLLENEAVTALKEKLLPLAEVITPNIPEAEVLSGEKIAGLDDIKSAARKLGEKYVCACLIKGGHLESDASTVADVLYADGKITVYEVEKVDAVETHGTGCSFAAALTAALAHGYALAAAVAGAQQLVANALAGHLRAGRHTPLGIGAKREE